MSKPDPQVLVSTERLYVRQWVIDDWTAARPLFTDPRVLQYIDDGQPWPDERIQKFISSGMEMARSRGWILWPVIHKTDSRLIGFCGFNGAFAPEVEIGWRLIPEYWGQGLATEAARALMDHGFATWKFPRLISVAQPANVASLRIMEKIGMAFDGQFEHMGIQVVRYSRANPNTKR